MKELLNFDNGIEEALCKVSTCLDALDGIKTEFVASTDPKLSRLGVYIQAEKVCYRDSREAVPLSKRLPFDHQKRKLLDFKARFLTLLRGAARLAVSSCSEIEGELSPLKSLMQEFNSNASLELLTSAQLKQKEIELNQKVWVFLDQMGLVHGPGRYHGFHDYFNDTLIGLRRLGNLTNTPAVVTISSMGSTDFQLAQIADPITTRTEVQSRMIASWGQAGHQDKNASQVMMQKAFRDTMIRYPRAQLGAQARYQFVDTLRNAYRSVALFIDPQGRLQEPFSDHVRTASIASDDRNISEEDRVAAASEDITQILNYVNSSKDNILKDKKRKGVEQIVLLEDGSRNNQSVLLKIIKQATQKVGVSFSNVGISAYAVYLRLRVTFSEFLNTLNYAKQVVSSYTEEGRVKKTAKLIQEAQKDKLIIYGCASNQNRAGTVSLYALSNELKEWFGNDIKKSAEHLASTGHEIYRSGLLEQGSRGLKIQSQKGKIFSTLFGWLASSYIYGGSSETRTSVYVPKKCHIDLKKNGEYFLNFKNTNNADMVRLKTVGYYAYVYHGLSRYLSKREASEGSELRGKKVKIVENALNEMRTMIEKMSDPKNLQNLLSDLQHHNKLLVKRHKISIFELGGGLLGDILTELQENISRALEVKVNTDPQGNRKAM